MPCCSLTLHGIGEDDFEALDVVPAILRVIRTTRDPKDLARQGGKEGLHDMPLVTIENVDRVDTAHVVVTGNDFPFPAGRRIDKAGDTEFVLLDVPGFLRAK